MLRLLNSKKSVFGLDIGTSSLKAMLLENVGKSVKVQGFSQGVLPKGVIINDTIIDTKTFNYVLEQVLSHSKYGKINTNLVIASLPESKSFVRVIQIPIMSDQEAEDAVPFEAENFIPLPIDQVYLDWQKLDVVGDKMNILIIASPKSFVDKYLEVLDQANLKTVALEVESQSISRALVGKASQETMLIADVQGIRSSLIMVEKGSLQFTSSIPIAGNAFTESIARALGVSSTKAEEIKKKVGIANTSEYPNIRNSLLPVLNSFSAEIRNILKFHSEHSENPVNRILLSGSSVQMKNFSEFLSMEFQDMPGLKVELGSPWINVPALKNAPMEGGEALSFATTIGLAMRGANII